MIFYNIIPNIDYFKERTSLYLQSCGHMRTVVDMLLENDSVMALAVNYMGAINCRNNPYQ